jgi:hypothetical protein
MNFLNQTRFIERLQFFNGQRLFATDLQGLEAFNREMRWLHNKSLHQPGIGNGLAVSGKKGDREVTIGPGYAIDAEGHEIVLTQSVAEPVPPVAGEEDGRPALFDLTISYPDDAFLEETERREGICRQPGGVIRLQEEPVFCWVRLKESGQPLDDQLKSEIAAGMRIVLARAEVLNCQLDKDISIAQRLSARPAKQPYVCCGTAEPDWQPWMIATFEPEGILADREALNRLRICPFISPVGLQAEIDTSQCRFLTAPCYSARISGPRIKQITTSSDAGPQVFVAGQTFTIVIDGLVQIINPLPNKFTVQILLLVQLLLPATDSGEINLAPLAGRGAAKRQVSQLEEALQKFIKDNFSDWHLVWMGVEG